MDIDNYSFELASFFATAKEFKIKRPLQIRPVLLLNDHQERSGTLYILG